MASDRFERFLPIAGVLAGLLLLTGLILLRSDPDNEASPAKTFAYWQADHGQHQIIGMIVAPLIAFLLLFFGAGLKRRLEAGGSGTAHGSVAFAGTILAAATFALVGMLESAMASAAHQGQSQAVFAINQIHAYDWLGWNAAFSAILLATGLGARRNGVLPKPFAWATIVIGASLLTPLGFFGFILLPLWLVVAPLLLLRRRDLVV